MLINKLKEKIKFNIFNTNLLPSIESCDLSLAYQCNLKCKMCFFWKNNPFNANNTLTNQQWEKILKQIHGLPNSKNFDISFTGAGEVLLHPHILPLIELANKLNLNIRINSNGYIIDQKIAKSLGKSKLKLLSLSIDSLNQKTHDFLRGKEGALEKAMQAIKHMSYYSKSTLININAIISKPNLGELTELANWAQNNKHIFSINFFAINKPFSFNNEPDSLWFKKNDYSFLWPDNANDIDAAINSLIKLKQNNYKIANNIDQLNAFRKYFKNEPQETQSGMCRLKKINRLVIDPMGNVSICSNIGIIDNINNNRSLKQILRSQKAQKHINSIKTCNKNCSTC